MDVLLFRTHKIDPQIQRFCERLRQECGMKVVWLVDESRSPLDVAPFEKVSINPASLADLGLYAPADSPWRCGDYGLYLAAQSYPEVLRFWLIEYDVRIHSSTSLASFFAAFADSDADLLAPLMNERGQDWWWYPAMKARSQPVFGCLFPILRVSSRLLATALQRRRAISRSPIYRLFWPNDESFLATTAVRAGFTAFDLNDFGSLYTNESFSFDQPCDGDELERSAADGLIYHPVLYGKDLERKRALLAKPSTFQEKLFRKLRNLSADYA